MYSPLTKPCSRFTDYDIHLFKEGKHFSLYEKLGSHLGSFENEEGVFFALWAPSAKNVHVKGDFNGWNSFSHPLYPRWDSSGIWEGFIPKLKKGALYKYVITSVFEDKILEKGDPFAFFWETPPKTASIVWNLSSKKQNKRPENRSSHKKPMSIYEMHLGSWRKKSAFESLSYKELAKELPSYLVEMGFTHVEFMPVMEHPFYGSWGYQKTGYFAPSSRFGTPDDFLELIESLHQAKIKVILDWVPSHFPSDPHSLVDFDGSSLFEHKDPKLGFHPDWKSAIFNYGRKEVFSFLISSASFWMDKYHIDGLRVDAVSSMLYLDYSRKEGEWIPNIYGGNENLEAIMFLKTLNEHLYGRYSDIDIIAEESTAWPMVSRPTSLGGLGFGYKWNMGWMHDTLEYFCKDPIYRKFHHPKLLFSMCYFYNENFILSLSHDEVVYGKKSLIEKMPGDYWQKFANLRLLYGYMFTHPGKKLLFMGAELAQFKEWNHDESLDWDLLKYSSHKGIQHLIKDLNHLYQEEPSLYASDYDPKGFSWIHLEDADHSILSYLRKVDEGFDQLLIVCNFTPVPRKNYMLNVQKESIWNLILNTDGKLYGGSNFGILETLYANHQGQIHVTIPPLATLIYKIKN
jgi:1,4-alpha-glucan branching enzyme